MKGKSIVEVLLVFTLKFLIGAWILAQLVRLGLGAWGFRYSAGLVMILVPVCIILFTRRDWESLGLSDGKEAGPTPGDLQESRSRTETRRTTRKSLGRTAMPHIVVSC